LEGLIPDENILKLLNGMKSFGGLLNTRKNSDGCDIPYEINITYFEALKGTLCGDFGLQEQRFVCSQTIMLALKGIPAFYIHSLLATKNYIEGVALTGMNRTINRKKLLYNELEEILNSDNSHSRIFSELKRIIEIRKTCTDFNPFASQQIIDQGNDFFIISRNNSNLISVSNITSKPGTIKLSLLYSNLYYLTDLLTNAQYSTDDILSLLPYQTCWLKIKKPLSNALRLNM
jgi:sucrose phosphorylase